MIHNVSSGVSLMGFPGLHGYASTKGNIEALARTLSIEFRNYGITVTLIHPLLTLIFLPRYGCCQTEHPGFNGKLADNFDRACQEIS